MTCTSWRDRIERYADGEGSAEEMSAVADHLRGCAACAADVASRLVLKGAIRSAGRRYTPSPALRARVQRELDARTSRSWTASWMPWLAAAAAVGVMALVFVRGWSVSRQDRVFAELTDLHVATLASPTPVDVVSTDRHTVKPWFQGKIPFTFDLPELSRSPFSLEGGRVAYLEQSPGAGLLYRIGEHRISVFIFQERSGGVLAVGDGRSRRLTFNVESWSEGGLCYYVVGDVEESRIHELSELLKAASRS